MNRSHRWLLCILAAAVLGGCGIPRTHEDLRSSRPPAPAEGELRVMSFNVRVKTILDLLNPWSSRRDGVARTIQRFNPDVLGTQEVLASQLDDLKRAMPEFASVGAGRSDGADDGEMCAILYRPDRFKKLDEGHFWLSRDPHKPGSTSWGAVWSRMTTWLKLRPRDGGGDFYVFNTHFAVASGNARHQAARLLRQRIDAIAGDSPTILTGDFNTTQTSTTYRTLLRGTPRTGPFVDTYRAIYPDTYPFEATRHGFRGTLKGQRIDWILASDDFRPRHAAIVRDAPTGRLPSDHYPVTAVLSRVPHRQARADRAHDVPPDAVKVEMR